MLRFWRCCGGGRWRCLGSRVAAPGGAAAVLNVRRCYCFFSVFSTRFQLSLPLPIFRSFFFLPFPLFSRSVFSFLCFFYVFLSSWFLSSFGSSSFSPLFFRFLLLLFPQCSWVLFIEPRAWLFTALMGSSRLVGHWARLPRFGPPPRFSGWCAVGGRPVCSVGGLYAREGPAKKFKLKHPFSFFPAACLGGIRKMNNVIQNDTVLLFLFLFF